MFFDITLFAPTTTLSPIVMFGQIKVLDPINTFENSGTRDKQTFSGRGAIRTLYRASLHREKDMILLEFTGDGFLRNMVRNIVGTALDCGKGRLAPEQFKKILNAKDRTCAGPTAPPHGLSLVKVFY